MPTYTFITPTVEEGPAGGGRLFSFYRLNRGVSVYNDSGTYVEIRFPTEEIIKGYPEFYLGGHNHVVDSATAANLIAAGYEVITT